MNDLKERIEEKQKELIENFKKLQLFSYFDRFDEIIRFLRVLVITFIIFNAILLISSIYLVTELKKETKLITAEAKSVTMYLNQQEILNVSTLASRIATDYFSLSYDNFDEILKSLKLLIYPRTRPTIMKQLEDLRKIIVKGKIIQYPEKIYYSRVKAKRTKIRLNAERQISALMVIVPVKIAVKKADSDDYSYYESTFVVYFVPIRPSLTNPYGLAIYQMGQVSS